MGREALSESLPTLDVFRTPQDFHENLQRVDEACRATPVFRSADGSVYLAGYDACQALLAERRFSRLPPGERAGPFGDAKAGDPMAEMIGKWILFMDPPRHGIVRRAFDRALGARIAADGERLARQAVAAGIASLRTGGETDLTSAFARPVPTRVLCALLDLPQEDHAQLIGWSDALTRALDTGAEAALREAEPAGLALRDYLARFSQSPAARRGSFLAALADSGELSADELVCGMAFLVLAGQETTRHLIGNAMLALCQHPDEMEKLREELRETLRGTPRRDPAALPAAVEEVLRFSSPAQKISRWTGADEDIGGRRIPAGTLVTALLGLANRDPAVFEEPSRFDVRRSPNRHLAFGRGAHACPGASLARLEAQLAIEALLGAFPAIRHVSHRWQDSYSLRGLAELRVVLA